jgi:hypothetical protein
MSDLYYVFDDEQTAIDAEARICEIGNAPVTGVNAKTGQPAPDKCKTERWAVPQQRITDNKWVFPYVGDELAEQYPEEVRNAFNADYPHIKEEYDSGWFPDKE